MRGWWTTWWMHICQNFLLSSGRERKTSTAVCEKSAAPVSVVGSRGRRPYMPDDEHHACICPAVTRALWPVEA